MTNVGESIFNIPSKEQPPGNSQVQGPYFEGHLERDLFLAEGGKF